MSGLEPTSLKMQSTVFLLSRLQPDLIQGINPSLIQTDLKIKKLQFAVLILAGKNLPLIVFYYWNFLLVYTLINLLSRQIGF